MLQIVANHTLEQIMIVIIIMPVNNIFIEELFFYRYNLLHIKI